VWSQSVYPPFSSAQPLTERNALLVGNYPFAPFRRNRSKNGVVDEADN